MYDKSQRDLPRFPTKDDVENDKKLFSVTKECQVIANETSKIRILDTPGFFPSDLEPGTVTIQQANQQIVRWIVYEQLEKKMKFKRLLYFFPCRGIPDNADGTLQEELKMLYHFFGTDVFDHMVIIATQESCYQSYDFSKERRETIQDVFCAVVERFTSGTTLKCRPPVVYIGLNDAYDVVLQKIKAAPVIGKSHFVPDFRDNVCTRCGDKIRYSKAMGVGVLKGAAFEKYEESKCHPFFIRKYDKAEKIAGGVGHIATLGIVYSVDKLRHKVSWPGFFNSDEMCPYCKRSPGSMGCCDVDKQVVVEGQNVTVYHTNKL